MEIVLKIEEVKPGEKGGGEEGMVEDVKGEALNAHGQDTVALGEGVLESVAVVEAESEGQKTVAFVEGVLVSEVVVEAERQTVHMGKIQWPWERAYLNLWLWLRPSLRGRRQWPLWRV